MTKMKRESMTHAELTVTEPSSREWLCAWLQEGQPAGWFSVARWLKLKKTTRLILQAEFKELF